MSSTDPAKFDPHRRCYECNERFLPQRYHQVSLCPHCFEHAECEHGYTRRDGCYHCMASCRTTYMKEHKEASHH